MRASTKGLTLIITKPFSSQRDAEQGLARVGRYGDACERLQLEGVELVDYELNAKLVSTLLKSRESQNRPNLRKESNLEKTYDTPKPNQKKGLPVLKD